MSHIESKKNHACKEEGCCSFKSRAIFGELRTPRMVTWLVKKGIVKSEMMAGKILLILTTLCFVLAILISSSFFFGFSIGSEKREKNGSKSSMHTGEAFQKATVNKY